VAEQHQMEKFLQTFKGHLKAHLLSLSHCL